MLTNETLPINVFVAHFLQLRQNWLYFAQFIAAAPQNAACGHPGAFAGAGIRVRVRDPLQVPEPSHLSIIALVLASVAMAYQRLARRGARRMRFSIL